MLGPVCFWIFRKFAIFNHFTAETVRITVFLDDFLCSQFIADFHYLLIGSFNRSFNVREKQELQKKQKTLEIIQQNFTALLDAPEISSDLLQAKRESVSVTRDK